MTAAPPHSVIVLGAGPAGLTAAYRLACRGAHVTLVDQSPAVGEHFRREGDPPLSILGCHHATWSLLQSLGIRFAPPAFSQTALEFLLPDGRLVPFPTSPFRTPLHQLFTIGRFAGLSRRERWRLLSWLEQIWEGALPPATDLEHRTAQDWVESLGHDPGIVRTIWDPLARWLTGNDLGSLSADAFAGSLKPFFLSRGADNRIAVPRQPWHRMFVQRITDSLTVNGAALRLGTQAVQLRFEQDRITGLRTQDGTVLRADWYVAAVAHHRLTPLLPERWLTRYAYFQQIAELTALPWTLIQVRAPQRMMAPRHILMSDGPFSWIAGKPSELDQSLVATLAMPQDRAVVETEQQVSDLLRTLGLLERDARLTGFRQQELTHAALALPPGTKVRRPIQRSPIPNFLVAGAWTDTGWPANFESAIVSGERCADIILTGRKAA